MIDLDEFKFGTTLLAPNYIHPQIREAIVNQTTGTIGLRMFSLHNWLLTYTTMNIPSKYQTLFEYKHKLETIKSKLSIYKELCDRFVFLNECYEFLDTLCFWEIPVSTLPQDTLAQKELYIILQALSTFQCPSHTIHQALLVLQHQRLDHLYILETYQTIEDQHILQMLYKQGAKRKKIQPSYEPKKHFFHAVNKRQEIEACAQYIITHKLQAQDIQITLANLSYTPIIKQIFERYHIPFTILCNTQTSIIASHVCALFRYYLYPDTEHLLMCIEANIFQIEGIAKLRDYITLFAPDIYTPFHHLQDIKEFGHIMDEHQIHHLKEMEQEAEAIRFILVEMVEGIVHPQSYEDLMYNVMHLVRAFMPSYMNEKHVLLQIEQIMKDAFPYIRDREDIDLLLSFIESITKEEQPNELKGVLIKNLQQTCLQKSHHFMIGCTQTAYPAFSPKAGMFDENYYAHLQGYPSMETRYQFYLDEVHRQLHTSSNLYVSYPLGSYEGKGWEVALELEQFIGNSSIAYPLYTNYNAIENPFTLTKDIAQQLFVHETMISGSISAIERYVKCPFSYFLRYGLSLREPMQQGVSTSYTGTLFHYVLESLVDRYEKEYTQSPEKKVKELIHTEMNVMKAIYPSLLKKLEHVEARIIASISQTLLILREFEKHSILRPKKDNCEYTFLYHIPLTSTIQLALRGVIDRIDQSDEYTCVFDYKSSPKSLSEDTVFSALQLQLLTYSIIANKEFNKDVLGAYYISLRNENINVHAGKLSRRKPITYIPSSNDEYQEIRLKAHRFQGWTMHSELSVLDDSGSHIVGLSQNKTGDIKSRKLYNLQTIETYFLQMYQTIGNRILHGDIRCTPVIDACMFCKYQQICRFKGVFSEKEILIETDEQLYQHEKGSEQNA